LRSRNQIKLHCVEKI